MSRQFVFGCSYTNFRWPTWAELSYSILKEHGYADEFYQYGISGSGNELIARTVELADSVHKFTDDDIVIINFTHWDRIDSWGLRLNANDHWPVWNVGGNWVHNGTHGLDYKPYYSEVNNILNNTHWIQHIKERYPNALCLGQNYYIDEPMGNAPLSAVNEFEQYMYTESMKISDDNPLCSKFCINSNLQTGWFWDNRLDTHPSMIDHHEFLCRAMYPLWETLGIDCDSYRGQIADCEAQYSAQVAENIGVPYKYKQIKPRDEWYDVDVNEDQRELWMNYLLCDSHDELFKQYNIERPNSNNGLNLWHNESNLGKDIIGILKSGFLNEDRT